MFARLMGKGILMRTKLLWVAACLALPSFSMAFPIDVGAMKIPADASSDCINFSGKWKGKCVVKTGSSTTENENTTTIEQKSCVGFSENGKFRFFGAVHTESTSIPPLPSVGFNLATATS